LSYLIAAGALQRWKKSLWQRCANLSGIGLLKIPSLWLLGINDLPRTVMQRSISAQAHHGSGGNHAGSAARLTAEYDWVGADEEGAGGSN